MPLAILVVLLAASLVSPAAVDSAAPVEPSEGGRYPVGTTFRGPCSLTGTFDIPSPPWADGQTANFRRVESSMGLNAYGSFGAPTVDWQVPGCKASTYADRPQFARRGALATFDLPGRYLMVVSELRLDRRFDSKGRCAQNAVFCNDATWWTETFREQTERKVHFTLYEPAGLVAVATASSTVRGGTLTLDGSKSKGNIVSYSWKVSRGDDCPAGTKFDAETLSGARVSLRALCSVKATLTVKDTKSSKSANVVAAVTPRAWKTPFAHVVEGRLNALLVAGHLLLGRNVCALDGLEGEQQSGHILHRGGANGPTDGFDLAEIVQGPFAGNWYVSRYTAQVRRASLISKDLFPGSDLYAANRNAGKLADLSTLRNSVRAHELLHSQLVKEELGRTDKAKVVEAMVGTDEGQLSTRVNMALIGLEESLTAATADAKVKARMRPTWSVPATVLVRKGAGSGFTSRHFLSLAELGDEG